MIDYYKILGVERAVSIKEIRKAYIRQCKRWHPDRTDATSDPQAWAESNARFQLINDAHEALKDPLKRRQYDEQLSAQGAAAGPKPTTQQKEHPAPRTSQYVRSNQPRNDLRRRSDIEVGDYLRSLGRGKGFWRNYYNSLSLDNRIAVVMMLVMALYVLWRVLLG